jgi:nucleoside phosphorylase
MEDFRPPHILLVGIAGGVSGRDNTQLGDVVLPDFIEYYEMRKISDGRSKRRMEPYDHPSHRLRYQMAEPMLHGDWLARISPERRPVQDGNSPKVIVGNLIAGEKILGDNDDVYQRSILNEYDKAIAVDMESWGVAKAVYQMRATRHYDPQCLVIRGISDLVNEQGNNATRQQWRMYAAHVGAGFAAALTERVLHDW